jgi:hypothetical protein
MSTTTTDNCCLCAKPIRGFGNNPAPLGEPGQRCCESCNYTRVMPARLIAMLGPEHGAAAAKQVLAVAREHVEIDDEEEEEDDAASDSDFEDCEDCGYTHLTEDKCPSGSATKHYVRWRDEGMEVYQVVEGVDELLPPTTSLRDHSAYDRFRTTAASKTTYYQTFGGGPEGGYFVVREVPTCATGCGCELSIYEVSRTWGEPWTITALPAGTMFKYEAANEEEGKPACVKLDVAW